MNATEITNKLETSLSRDEILLIKAATLAVKNGKISTSLVQRKLMIGYGRAAKLIDALIELEYVLEAERCKPNMTVVTKNQLQKAIDDYIFTNGKKISITVDEIQFLIEEETKMTFEKFCIEIKEIFEELYSDIPLHEVVKRMQEKEEWLKDMFKQECTTGDAAYELRMLWT